MVSTGIQLPHNTHINPIPDLSLGGKNAYANTINSKENFKCHKE